jgi:hypothetical protein
MALGTPSPKPEVWAPVGPQVRTVSLLADDIHTWIVALPHLFGGRLIGVPGCRLIDGCLPPPDAGRKSLGLTVRFGDARSLQEQIRRVSTAWLGPLLGNCPPEQSPGGLSFIHWAWGKGRELALCP